MAWVIWHYNDEKGRREYVRRITPRFVSYSVDFADARRFPSKADARAALAGTGLTVGRVRREDGADVEPADPAPAVVPLADDDGPPFT